MKLFLSLFLFLFLSAAVPLNGQIPIEGNFVFGDSTQVHLVEMTNGDLLKGRITSFDEQTISFLYMGNSMNLSIDEVASIKVLSANGATPPSPTPPRRSSLSAKLMDINDFFEYKLVTSTGEEHLGILLEMDRETVTMLKNELVVFKINEIKSINLLGKWISEPPSYTKDYHRLKLASGSAYKGQLVFFDGNQASFLKKSGTLQYFDYDKVKYVSLIHQGSKSSKHRDDPYYNQQRLVTSSTPFLLEEGDKELRSLLLYNSLDIGVNKNLTLGGGLVTLIWANGLTGKIKVGTQLMEHLHVAAELQGYAVYEFYGYGYTGGIMQGIVAIGTSERFINFSIGLGDDSDSYNNASTIITAGGSYRFSKNWRGYAEYVLFNPHQSDNYYRYNENNYFSLLGVSWFNHGHQLDFGIGSFADHYFNGYNETPTFRTAFPYVQYSFRF